MKTIVFGLSVFFVLSFGNRVEAQMLDSAAVVREVDSLISVSEAFIKNREYENALKTIDLIDKITLDTFGEMSVWYAKVCYNKAAIYFYFQKLSKAEEWWLKAKGIRENVLGKNHLDYATVLNDLAVLYYKTGKYTESELLHLEAKSIRENVLGKEHLDYARSLHNLANLYIDMGKYNEAESLYLEARRIREKTLDKQSPDFAGHFINMGRLYRKMINDKKAESYYLEAKRFFEVDLRETDHPLYVYCLNGLAIVYLNSEDYGKAEVLLLKAIDIQEKLIGKGHPDYTWSLNNLAILYKSIGDYRKGERLYLEVKDIREKTLGREHPQYAAIIENLAILYFRMGDYDKAEPLYLEAKDIKAKALGKNHPDYASMLYNLAIFYNGTGSFEKAEPLYLEALNIWEAILGEESPKSAECLSGLASNYRDKGNYVKAEPLYLESKAIQEKTLGKEHPDYRLSLHNLAILSFDMRRYGQLAQYDLPLFNLLKKQVTSIVTFLSESELEKYIKVNIEEYVNQIQYVGLHLHDSEFQAMQYNAALLIKGLQLQTGKSTLEFVLQQQDSSVLETYHQLTGLRRRLSAQYQLPITERKGVEELEAQAEEKEKYLTRLSAAFRQEQEVSRVTVADVKKAMKEDEATIEFVHFWPNNPTDSSFYAALVLLPQDTAPRYVFLFEEKQLDNLLATTGSNAVAANQLYAAPRRQNRSGIVMDETPAYGAELYKLIWKPLDSLLRGVKTVHFSPSGLLHRVAFAALPVSENKLLRDRYTLHQLGSTRSLVVKTPEPLAKNYSAAVFGGIQYDRRTIQPAGDSSAEEITDNRLWNYLEHPRSSTGAGFDYLPGTAEEAARITRALEAQRVIVHAHTGDQATEEALKSLGRDAVKSPDILHIATHGFFFPDPEIRKEQRFGDENVFKWNENPLFRSGLVLAGANPAWKGQPTPAYLEDGIATAYEISHLNLSDTKLVVLSACETGLGDIKGSEGVYGLQRAFKMAGADYLLVSLWQVPDKETVEFMDVFYKSWLSGKTIHESFAKAQKKMRKKYKEVYKWGAWVLIE